MNEYFLIHPFQKVKLPFNLNIFLSFIQLQYIYIYAPHGIALNLPGSYDCEN